MRGLLGRFFESQRAVAGVLRNPRLLRLELAWAFSIVGTWAFTIAVAVFAFEHGGARAVGLVGLLRWVAAGLVSPFAAVLGDRYDRRKVMIASDLSRAVLVGGAAASAYAHAPPSLVYAFTGLMSVAGTPFRPAEAAYTPALAQTPEELSAANVVASTIESVGIFAGPALGGLLLAVTTAGTVFAVTAGTVVVSAWLLASIRPVSTPAAGERPPESVREEILAGVATIAREPRLRLLVGLFSVQTFVDGVFGVLIVVFALRLLSAGVSWVGFLNCAVGVGGVVGAAIAATLIGRGRLARDFGLGVALFGLPIALAGAWPQRAFALLLMAVLGVGNTLVDVSGMTLLQRSAPDAVLARVFGVLEGLFLVTVGLGAIVGPTVLSALGERGALIATGLVLPTLAALGWRRLTAMDTGALVSAHRLDALRRIAIFSPLPEATLERLAEALVDIPVEAGTTVVRQGEPGDRFYIVGKGRFRVEEHHAPIASLGSGDYFGEIALLRDIPRTATVVAETDGLLLALDRDHFIPAVTGYAPSLASANAVVGMRLGPARAGIVRA